MTEAVGRQGQWWGAVEVLFTNYIFSLYVVRHQPGLLLRDRNPAEAYPGGGLAASWATHTLAGRCTWRPVPFPH